MASEPSPAKEAATPKEATSEKKKPSDVLYVHFIPPPLREPSKKHLPWIVHTCDGKTGCKEAKHVLFKTLSGFETCACGLFTAHKSEPEPEHNRKKANSFCVQTSSSDAKQT